MKKRIYRMTAGLAILLGTALFLGGCGQNSAAKAEKTYEEFLVVDVFDTLSNYQGIQSGWFGKLVKDKFNMELNIIAPNVAGGGTTLFESRAAAGNIGDLIICSGENGNIQNIVTEGLLLDMSPYLEGKEILRYSIAIDSFNDAITPEGIYAIPSEVSLNSPMTPAETLSPTYGPYVRWDLYKELGYPEIGTLEDILPVLRDMQDLEPVAENGKKTYAFSFFKDWDANMMNAAKQPCCFYGYDELGFLLIRADGSDIQSILDDDSIYVRVLKLFFDANQMGLVDPDSRTQSYDEFEQKYINGQILYAPWPWVSQTNYNTDSHLKEGKGFMMADIGDMQIYSYGCSMEGVQKLVMAVGAQTKDPERMVDFVDWLYSPEGIAASQALPSSRSAGPEGLCWEYGEDGAPVLTDFGKKALYETNVEVSEEWGGGTWADGISRLNYIAVRAGELDDNGYPYAYELWDSVKGRDDFELEADWKQHMGADNAMEYLEENGKLLVLPGSGFMGTDETAEMIAVRSQCCNVILRYSWDMVFAKDEEEFYSLLSRMQQEAKSLGYDSLVEIDEANAIAKIQAGKEAVERCEELGE